MSPLLLTLLLQLPLAGPPAVRVTFSPFTKAAYLAAKKAVVVTKPVMTFPVQKVRGRLVIPTAKGAKVFQDKGIGTDEDDQAEHVYHGYLPQFGYHVIETRLWERTQWLLLDKQGRQLAFYEEPLYSPDMKHFIIATAGIEYSVYPNEIQLFQLVDGRWRQVWNLEPSVEPASWEPYEVQWLSNSTLLLKKKMWTGSNPGNTFTYAKLTTQL